MYDTVNCDQTCSEDFEVTDNCIVLQKNSMHYAADCVIANRRMFSKMLSFQNEMHMVCEQKQLKPRVQKLLLVTV